MLWYVLNFDNHSFKTSNNEQTVIDCVEKIIASGISPDCIEIINAFCAEGIGLSVGEFKARLM